MATADELLATADEYLDINAVTREISIPSDESLFGVYSDHDVERKCFRCPRIVGDNVDLSECYIFVNYTAVSGKEGSYLVDDLTFDDEYVYFSWLLSSNVFDKNVAGTVAFSIRAKILDADGETLTHRWNTTIASASTKITLEGDAIVENDYADLTAQLLQMVDTSSECLLEISELVGGDE
ncbi:MAG: hypothetical protein LUF78_10750 [Clostridiales bacterium]|nr:hypothetical protein [Clostridiales bacterium]